MTLIAYNIRAEYAGNAHEDFKVTAEDASNARILAEEKICREKKLSFIQTVFNWRGMVVFINQSPSV